MDGKVDVAASGVQPVAMVQRTSATEASARAKVDSASRAPQAERPPHEDVKGPSFRPSPEEIPPNWVFAPGFLHADRRGLVPYPGVDLPDGILASVLLKRYLEQTTERTHAAKAAYGAVS
jgi:hypothetical protein